MFRVTVPAPDGPRRSREPDGPLGRRTTHRRVPRVGRREAEARAHLMGGRPSPPESLPGCRPHRTREEGRGRRGPCGLLPIGGARAGPRGQRLLRRSGRTAQRGRPGARPETPRGGESDAGGPDRSGGPPDEHGRVGILESIGLPDAGPDHLQPRSSLTSVDDRPVGPVRLLSELLPAFRTPDPRARALWILGLQRTEQLGHLEGDFLGLGLGPMERGDVPHEVDVQVDLRTFRDALEPVRLEAHVETLAVVQGPERDDVERLTLHAIPQDEARGLDGMQCHPPRQGRFHRIAPQSPYATFADTSEYPSGQSSSGPTWTTRIRVPGPMPIGWHSR